MEYSYFNSKATSKISIAKALNDSFRIIYLNIIKLLLTKTYQCASIIHLTNNEYNIQQQLQDGQLIVYYFNDTILES